MVSSTRGWLPVFVLSPAPTAYDSVLYNIDIFVLAMGMLVTVELTRTPLTSQCCLHKHRVNLVAVPFVMPPACNAYDTIPSSADPQHKPAPPHTALPWRVQMGLIYLMEFAAESSRGIVMPTLFLYCQSVGGTLANMGVLTSTFSIGRMVSSMALGYLCDRGSSYRLMYILCLTIGLVGNIVYVLADAHADNSLTMLVVSRFLVGVGAGNRSACRADVARMTSIDQRLTYMTLLSTVTFLGYALTPGVGGLLARVDITIFGGLSIHQLNAPGVVLAGLNLVLAISMGCAYNDSMHEARAAPSPQRPLDQAPDQDAFELPPSVVAFGVGVFFLLNIVGRGLLSIFETINVPLYLQVTGLSGASAVQSAASFQFNTGLLGLLSYVAVLAFRDSITDTMWLYMGLAGMVVGNGLLFLLWPLSFHALAIGMFFVWSVGSPLTSTVSVAAFSKLLGSRQQGTWMGLFGSATSVSRIVLPLLPALFDTFSPMFLLCLALSVVGIASLAWFDALATQAKQAWKHPFTPATALATAKTIARVT